MHEQDAELKETDGRQHSRMYRPNGWCDTVGQNTDDLFFYKRTNGRKVH